MYHSYSLSIQWVPKPQFILFSLFSDPPGHPPMAFSQYLSLQWCPRPLFFSPACQARPPWVLVLSEQPLGGEELERIRLPQAAHRATAAFLFAGSTLGCLSERPFAKCPIALFYAFQSGGEGAKKENNRTAVDRSISLVNPHSLPSEIRRSQPWTTGILPHGLGTGYSRPNAVTAEPCSASANEGSTRGVSLV